MASMAFDQSICHLQSSADTHSTETPLYERLAPEIRGSLFLITGLCLGLPTLVWSLYALYYHQKASGKISAFVIFLLLSDVLEISLIPYITRKLLSTETCCHTCTECRIISSLWSGAKFCGLHFHLLVALEGILSVKCTCIFSHLSSVFACLTICSMVFTCEYFGFPLFIFYIFGNLVPIVILAFIYKYACTFPLTPEHSPGTASRLLAVAIVTFALYEPVFIVSCGMVSQIGRQILCPVLRVTASLSSLRLITDPLLCVLVCRENPKGRKPQTHTELRSV